MFAGKGVAAALAIPALIARAPLAMLCAWLAAMPATAKHGTVSRIVPVITEGSAITTPRNDVNYIVTEYGVAQLKGRTLKERAKELIKIAHPKFRPYLMIEYKKRFGEAPFTAEEQREFTSEIIDELKEKIKNDHKKLKEDIRENIDNLENIIKNI